MIKIEVKYKEDSVKIKVNPNDSKSQILDIVKPYFNITVPDNSITFIDEEDCLTGVPNNIPNNWKIKLRVNESINPVSQIKPNKINIFGKSGGSNVQIYQRGGLHPSKWLPVAKVTMSTPGIISLYYARADEGNELISINCEPNSYHRSGPVMNGNLLSTDVLNTIDQAGWWNNNSESDFVTVPVFQRGGHHPSKWINVGQAKIPKQYAVVVRSLYYERKEEGNRLLSVCGVPDYYHPHGIAKGAGGLPSDFLNSIDQCGWWGNAPVIGGGFFGGIGKLSDVCNFTFKLQ